MKAKTEEKMKEDFIKDSEKLCAALLNYAGNCVENGRPDLKDWSRKVYRSLYYRTVTRPKH
jgi:hypothetical protein